jgi:hypothetical protein
MAKREPTLRTDKRQLPLSLGDAGPAIQLQAAKDAGAALALVAQSRRATRGYSRLGM